VSRNEDFDNAFWDQPVVEELSAPATLLYIWSWTNPRCGMAGIYETGRRAMTESKVTLDELDGVLEELAGHKLAFYVQGVLWVVARVKRLRTKTIWVAKSIAKDVTDINPAHPLRRKWLEHHRNASWLASALAEAHLSLTSTSGEPHEKLDTEPNSETLTRTSTEVPLTGLGRSTTSDQGHRRLTREIVDEAIAVLSPHFPEVTEEHLIGPSGAHPNADMLQGCHLAVAWASGPTFEMRGVGPTLASALGHLERRAAKPGAQTDEERRLEWMGAGT
jgi:hypothetical protein